MNRILIIGAQNIDIFTKSECDLVIGDSNPAKINLAFGGVGRNISVNMKRLGHDVHFLSVFGNDTFSQSSQNSLKDLGVKFGESLFHKSLNSSIYLGVMDKSNDLHLGFHDMKIIDELKPEFLQSKLDYIKGFNLIVIDNNLPEESIVYLLNNLKGKTIAIDAVSAYKTRKLQNHLDKISILKLNQLELNELSQLTSSLEQLAELHKKGAKTVLLTNQDNESYVSKTGELISQKPESVQIIVNATGAGDAFLSGYLHGFLSEKNENDRLKMANFAAGITLISKESTSKDLRREKLEKAINE